MVTKKGRVVLAEFGYEGKLMPSFPVDPAQERYSMWLLKTKFLPFLYWNLMLRGVNL
jgi:sulfide:quinone oxidoreductase